MKEKQTDPEKTIVIDIKLTRGLMVVLSCVLAIVVLLAYLTLMGERAAASETGTSGEASSAQSTGMRQFYLTRYGHQGDEALTVCSEGYHMASLWELTDPSNLKYNITYGYVPIGGDSGWGPPSAGGWVRTGYVANNSGGAGQANCSVWSTTDGGGTVVFLPHLWASGINDLGLWAVYTTTCDMYTDVWCIED